MGYQADELLLYIVELPFQFGILCRQPLYVGLQLFHVVCHRLVLQFEKHKETTHLEHLLHMVLDVGDEASAPDGTLVPVDIEEQTQAARRDIIQVGALEQHVVVSMML